MSGNQSNGGDGSKVDGKIDTERDYFAGAPARSGASRLAVALATCAAALGGWTLWSYGVASVARTAEAGPPAQSALTIQKRAESEQDGIVRALDAGQQREQLIEEVRALRLEVASLKEILSSAPLRVEVSNFRDLKQKEPKLEIDYAKLRDAVRQP